MSRSPEETYYEKIQQSLESEEVFRTYLSTRGNTKRMLNAFHTLRDLCVKAYENRDQLAAERDRMGAENAMLRKEV